MAKGGADRHPDPIGRDLQKGVARLISLPERDEQSLATYSVGDCDANLLERVGELNATSGKLTTQNAKLLGEMFLLLHQRSQQRELEFRNRMEASDREKRALEEDIRRLQENNTHLQQDIHQLQTEVAERQRESEDLAQSLHRKHLQVQQLQGEVEQLQVANENEVSNRAGPDSTGPEPEPQAGEPCENPVMENHEPEQDALPERRFIPRSSDTHQTTEYSRPVTFGAPPSSRAPHPFFPRPPPFLLHQGAGPSDSGGYPRRGGSDQRPRPREWYTPSPAQRGWYPSPIFDPRQDPYLDDPWVEQAVGLHSRQLESLARDIDRFDPDARGANIDTYLREVEYCLQDVPYASAREKARLLWRTTTRPVRDFIATLAPGVRESYVRLRSALREEYCLYADQTSAALDAFAMKQRREESPRAFFNRLRAAYFQGRHVPGLEEEDQGFKSLFLFNLHDSIRYDVSMRSRAGNFTIEQAKKYAQMAWEVRVRTVRKKDDDADIHVYGIHASDHGDLFLEGDEIPQARHSWKKGSPGRRSSHHQGERPYQGGGDHLAEEPAKPRWTNRPPPKVRAQLNRSLKSKTQESSWKGKAPFNPRRDGSEPDMEALIRECVAEAMRQYQVSPRSADRPDADSPSS